MTKTEHESSVTSYTESNATRLLCAGTYLDAGYRKVVIRELLGNQYRVVAPSYGYDVVPVLAHALAAQRLQRLQVGATLGCAFVILVLYVFGPLGPIGALLLLVWSGWAAAFLRRMATLDTMITRLKVPAGQTFDGHLPESERLTPRLIAKIDREQASDSGLIYYGGYTPFVGAGRPLEDWSSAELLIEAPLNLLASASADAEPDDDPAGRAFGRLVPFTVAEITSYVAAKLLSELRDDAKQEEKIRQLTVELRKFTKAVGKRRAGTEHLPLKPSDIHWEEGYDSAREYLCIRIGSWEQEIVTSMFVGFDIKGNTLHTEFYPYVLPPIKAGFHVVDRLPDTMAGLPPRIAWDALKAAPGDLIGAFLNPFADRLPRILKDETAKKRDKAAAAGSDLGLARYALATLDAGAVASVRELAASGSFHHFFQKSDTVKYRQIVERRLLKIIEVFLDEHNVDLSDHRAAQTTILNQSYEVHSAGDIGVVGNVNKGKQTFNGKDSAPRTPKKETV